MPGAPMARLRPAAAVAIVVLLALALGRAPTSGAEGVAAYRDGAAPAMVVPSAPPSLALSLPPVPLPSVPLPLPSVSVPPPSVDLESPLPSVSLPLPSLSLPVPTVSQPVPTATGPQGASPGVRTTLRPTAPSPSGGVSLGVSPSGSPGPSPWRLGREDGTGPDRPLPSNAGRAGGGEGEAEAPSWIVPALAFGVPLLLVVGAILAQLAGGAAVLTVARRALSRIPGPAPRWTRGASDPADGG